ncbi:MAG: hypothetical protein JO019_00885 [Candidatus Kaiserbacteria bacterium]|nr:hypothetical protein [Candidatus Kaiserbacteria bacterium]
MLYFYTGNDIDALRKKLHAVLAKAKDVVRISDAHSVHDLRAALEGGGMFSQGKGTVVLDRTLGNPEMREIVLDRLESLAESDEVFFIIEPEIDAATRKRLEKHAEVQKFDAPKVKKQETVFALANALQRGKKKDLWVGYQRELAAGKSPEAILGVLFWAAKQSLARSPSDAKARALLGALAELPHEARRAGFDLEYALERFILSTA